MFRGNAVHTVDAKGRMIVPAKFREPLGEKFVITKGLGGCLFVFTQEDFKDFEDKVKTLPLSDPSVRQFQRFFFGSAYDADMDNNGRALIPSDLREYAAIDKEIASVGVPGRLEIWSKEKWDEINDEFLANEDTMVEKMMELGI